jgi:hypothetical protein
MHFPSLGLYDSINTPYLLLGLCLMTVQLFHIIAEDCCRSLLHISVRLEEVLKQNRDHNECILHQEHLPKFKVLYALTCDIFAINLNLNCVPYKCKRFHAASFLF